MAKVSKKTGNGKAKKAPAPLTATIVDRRGSGVSGRLYWESSVSKTEISYAEAQAVQDSSGYHSMGYGFYGFSCQKVKGGYQATWNCAASCD